MKIAVKVAMMIVFAYQIGYGNTGSVRIRT